MTGTTAIAAIFVIALQVADMVTTLLALSLGAREANPIVAWLMRRLGTIAGLAFVKVVGVVLALALWSLDGAVDLWILAALYLWVVVHNLRVAHRRRRIKSAPD